MKKKNNKKKNKKNVKKKKIIVLSILGGLVLLLLILFTIYSIKNNNNNPTRKEKVKVDEIDDFGYYLEEDSTEYYKSLYEELKKIIKQDEPEKQEYAKIVSKMFLSDVFTLENKKSSNDIGGLQFIYPDFYDNFIKIAQTTLYSNIIVNYSGTREQKLPNVTNVEITNIEETTFEYNNNELVAYSVKAEVTYEVNLDYQDNFDLILVEQDNKIYVAKLN